MYSLTSFVTFVVVLHVSILTGQEVITLGVHFKHFPASVVAPIGDDVVFDCELNLKPDYLEWRFKAINNINKLVPYVNVQENITNEDAGSRLRIFVTIKTIGDYQCVAWIGSAAIASTTATLSLATIAMDNSWEYQNRHSIRYNVAPKNYVVIRCGNVISNPPAVWTYYHNSSRIETTENTNGALILNVVSMSDAGEYTCAAKNVITGQQVQLMRKIDLHVSYSDRKAPYFLETPSKEVAAAIGETVLLECPGVGTPPPEAVWSSPDVADIYNARSRVLPYGLRIIELEPSDAGTYICRLDNGIAPAAVHTIKLHVLEPPRIHHGPPTNLASEGEKLELSCIVTGHPAPQITWLINGADSIFDNETFQDGNRLLINHVEKRHAGIVQCFAKNEMGEVNKFLYFLGVIGKLDH